MNKDCIFCELAKDRIIDECNLTTTFRDGFPISTGHTLIIPKRHVATFFDLTQEEQAAVNKAIQKSKKNLDNEFSPDGYNIGMNNGEAAGQTVFHLHVHLIPRYSGDVENPKGGVRWVIADKADYWSNR